MSAPALTRPRGPLVGLALGAFACYAPGFWWGAPHATSADRVRPWGVDDETPLGTLGQVADIVAPRPRRNAGYPKMHALMSTAAMAPYIVWSRATGRMSGFDDEYPFGFADPVTGIERLSNVAHLLSVLLGVGIVLAAFDVGRVLWTPGTGVLSASFAAVVFPMFYYARTGNVDVPMLFFIALALSAYVRALRGGVTARRAVWAGIWIGLAVATKESAFGAVAPIPLVMAWIAVRNPAEAAPDGIRKPLLWGGLACVLAYGLGSGLFLDPGWYIDHVRFLLARTATVAREGEGVVRSYPRTLSGDLAYLGAGGRYLVSAMNPVIFGLGAVGVALGLRERRTRLLLIPALGYAIFMFLTVRTLQLRYVLPFAYVLAILAGGAVASAWRSDRAWLRISAIAAATTGLGIGLLWGGELTYEMVRDSRNDAARWLAARTESGDRVAYFGPIQKLPPLERGVVSDQSAPFEGMWATRPDDAVAPRKILDHWERTRPAFVIVMPDHVSYPGVPHNITLPPELFDALEAGATPFRPVARFRTEPLLPWTGMPALDYPTVNPTIRIYERVDGAARAHGGDRPPGGGR